MSNVNLMAPCHWCRATDHVGEQHFDVAFTQQPSGEPYDIPADIKKAATRIVMAYGLRGICDPMYVANVIAVELGRGDGQSNFTHEPQGAMS